MSNKKLGNDFEFDFCQKLASYGFWVHNLAQNKSGQPADVIAVKDGEAFLIDCKVCSSRGFALSRIEENQYLSMRLWAKSGNGVGWFALLMNEQIYMISLDMLQNLKAYCTIVPEALVADNGWMLEEWVKSWT